MSHTRSDQSMDGHSVWMKEIKTHHQHWRPPLLRSPAFFRCLTVKLKAAAVLANPCLNIASPYGRSRSPIWRTHVTRWHWQKNSHEARKNPARLWQWQTDHGCKAASIYILTQCAACSLGYTLTQRDLWWVQWFKSWQHGGQSSWLKKKNKKKIMWARES